MPEDFHLASEFSRDSLWLADWPLCQLRLQNDANYPWLILIPRLPDLVEIIDLSAADQQQLCVESAHLARFLREKFSAKKLNIAALGNMVPQLHIHHIVRYEDDLAWPAPVWGKHQARPYNEVELARMMQKLEGLGAPDKMF
ncbi:HIT domain-containing protein [Rheinheimera sp.]|uniref:HIT domain-containing protein n=1 Tax=Rheinheimera sp. TaxID=1869214 RepID=UPI00307E79C5